MSRGRVITPMSPDQIAATLDEQAERMYGSRTAPARNPYPRLRIPHEKPPKRRNHARGEENGNPRTEVAGSRRTRPERLVLAAVQHIYAVQVEMGKEAATANKIDDRYPDKIAVLLPTDAAGKLLYQGHVFLGAESPISEKHTQAFRDLSLGFLQYEVPPKMRETILSYCQLGIAAPTMLNLDTALSRLEKRYSLTRQESLREMLATGSAIRGVKVHRSLSPTGILILRDGSPVRPASAMGRQVIKGLYDDTITRLENLRREKAQEPLPNPSSLEFVQWLLNNHVPAIANGTVQITRIARKTGERCKVAVHSDSARDPVSLVLAHQKAIFSALGRERLDIIAYSSSPVTFVANALQPAANLQVEVRAGHAHVRGPACEIARAKGPKGINVQLAEALTGYRITIHNQ